MAAEDESEVEVIFNIAMAALCVSIAAVAAGLTLGMLSIDPLNLAIKIRTGTPEEQSQAEKVFPLISQHHRLLVTLLLLNSIANESLPLFLDELVPSWIAVLLSVTMVLLFGEILPSAFFTGPQQLQIAAMMTPFVQFIMWLLTPIALPISNVLDHYLGHSDEAMSSYNRMELSALVRIMYEEEERRSTIHHKAMSRASVRAAAAGLQQSVEESSSSAKEREHDDEPGVPHQRKSFRRTISEDYSISDKLYSDTSTKELHTDEVTMIEGALKMKVKTISEVDYVRLHDVYAISSDAVLDYPTVLSIYSSGHSRVPVYAAAAADNDHTGIGREEENNSAMIASKDAKSTLEKRAIIGVLKTKHLIVINPTEKRTISSMPLQQPYCISPDMNMIDLLNIFQRGRRGKRSGHLAIVCRDPKLARSALEDNKPIPHAAQVLGVITLEDVIEVLLQEPILDESDAVEVAEMNRAKWAVGKWRGMMQRKKALQVETTAQADDSDSNGGGGLLRVGGSFHNGYDSISKEVV
mmetsp:Transcript_19794/g.30393  ORF Transcript_19794/g.30393 Transcript_19794/m.30393 type:complete len:524 (-) Transcript_19794:117-1688(-)|eukprot:CAMPEP_0196815256 /NCGR_PEP_ID=MMETSP1362-20130617/48647_1 /TAXON_ID=163516 /ORGANISM="Leptocylindrus danicus, Strain CCMP1856" /LENGTH=523 /DNA_ID=CAMNT_0042192139 /DNA_START=177 /DNA_END=1748 /DNA_ORIENTATION=-